MQKKLQKTVDFNVMVKNLLNGCKVWGGPVTSAAEILETLRKNPDIAQKILRTEFAYYVHTHLTQKTQQPHLFAQNNISYEDKLGNFCVLLTDDVEECSATIANLPTNEDGMKALAVMTSSSDSPSDSAPSSHKENDMCAVVWKEAQGYVWYLGYISQIVNDGECFKVDHLHRFPVSQQKYWQYPKKADTVEVLPDQIVDVEVRGEWTLEERNRRFVLTNEKEVVYQFKQQIEILTSS